jgi:hypothetical protein
MSKSETMTTETSKAGERAALTDKDLDAVTGGVEVYSFSFGVSTGWESHSARRPSG